MNQTTPAPLISVIVPIYKVEAYLRPCVESILAQTYENLEVILVDDGSPDGCPAICDEFAARDGRVRVIHKPNGGLSDARNAGLDVARGEWIGFVDSDDTVDPDMFATLLETALREDAQVAVCNFYEFDDATGEVWWARGVKAAQTLDSRAALVLLMHDDELQNYAWNKLFARELWSGVRFPVGQKYEDVNTTYKLVERARRVALIPLALYNYRVRQTGIVGSRTFDGELDCVRANMQRCEDVLPRVPEAAQPMVDGVMKAILNMWPLAWECRGSMSAEQRAVMSDLAAFARQHGGSTSLWQRLGITGRAQLRLLGCDSERAWWAAHMLDCAYRLKHDGRGK